MKDRQAELKAQMRREAEAAIDRMLSEAAEKGPLTLTEIEQFARSAGEQIMAGMTATLVKEESEREESNRCPDCGEKMRNKGRKGRHLITETGEVWLERRYSYCESGHRGVFPPGSASATD